MKQELCCNVNTFALCSLCHQRWCYTHWGDETATHRDSSVFTGCPIANVMVYWSETAREDGLPQILIRRPFNL